MNRANRTIAGAALIVSVLLGGMLGAAEAQRPEGCLSGQLMPTKPEDPAADLVIQGAALPLECKVGPGTYYFGNVNILKGGTLRFTDPPTKNNPIHFWAKSILVENGGALIAGSQSTPIGAQGGVVTIHLYGADQGTGKNGPGPGKGIVCMTPPTAKGSPCGIPDDVWRPGEPDGAVKVTIPGVRGGDYFYRYDALPYDGGVPTGYFGYKVLAVSYGGTLQLFGKKGAANPEPTASSDSGTSWVRLNGSVKTGNKTLTVEVPGGRALDWESEDKIVLTTTDYLPGHSEELTIDTIAGNTITVKEPLKYDHNGVKYDMSRVPAGVGPDVKSAETRAAVALLSRSIRIVSAGGDKPPNLPPPDFPADSFFGGHTVARQGFQSFQVRGVEFMQLGQGGRLGHYPVHFHMARKTPADTFVKDSSINESMTRWAVLHATHGVLLARNVGWKSIGHGFYLEEGSEINNRLLSNIGIYARAAVTNADGSAQRDNPRKVPGILAAQRAAPPAFNDNVPFHTDVDHPTIFWIMNGWNDFEYNMAAGAGTCGACYWLVPGANSGMSRHMKWEGYASLQMWDNNDDEHLRPLDRAALSPLRKFVGNYCSTAQNSFNTVGDTTPCKGVGGPDEPFPHLQPVANPLAPPSCFQDNRNLPVPPGPPNTPDPNGCQFHPDADDYYPKVDPGGGRFATKCDLTDCRGSRDPQKNVPRCSNAAEANCTVTILDRYTSSFHWTETNFAAIWLRPQWYLVTNSVLSDVQNGGLTFITGGGYTQSDVINGHWALARTTAFIGNTQTGNPFSSNAGPFSAGGLSCDTQSGSQCLSQSEGVAFPISNFGVNQRLFNIYDGPAYQESNAYLDITPTVLADCHAFNNDCAVTPCVCSENRQCPTGTCTASGQCTCMDSKNGPQGNPDCPGKAGCSNGLCPLPSSLCSGSASMYGRVMGVTQDADHVCYLPNAAIAWKQPNGFYYPPAFHSRDLFFDPDSKTKPGTHNVDIRHFVIEPFFKARASEGEPLFKTDVFKVMDRYCTWNPSLFEGYTDVDRQTELNDDDGSLTGYVNTISVNEDPFFKAPVEAFECLSDLTAKTSPYDYVTTVVYPGCAVAGNCVDSIWSQDCANPSCFGVPLYRQYRTADETKTEAHQVKLMGQSIYQRSTLSVNGGKYYVDTTVGQGTQQASGSAHFSVFQGGQTYYLFLLFGKSTTTQTYQMYVGDGFNKDDPMQLSASRAVVDSLPIQFPTITPWPSGWKKRYGAADGLPSGILEVTIDLGAYRSVFNGSGANLCRPKRFCKWDSRQANNKCQCALSPGDYFYDECKANDSEICSWSVKDFACPDGGCYGITVTLPGGFDNNNLPSQRPPTACFPTSQTPWNVNFVPAPADLAGACHQGAPPPIPVCRE